MALRLTWPGLVVDGRESIRGAEHKVSALMQALVSWYKHVGTRGMLLGGDARGMTASEQYQLICRNLCDAGVNSLQIDSWLLSIQGRKLGDNHGAHTNNTNTNGSGTEQASSVGSTASSTGEREWGTISRWGAGVELDEYQLATVAAIPSGGGVCALGCGLGKTATALSASYTIGGDRLYVVCPQNAMGTWEQHRSEMEDMFPEVEIVSMDSLHKITGLSYKSGVVIFDEAHLLGVRKSDRTKRALKLRLCFDVGLCLTGTLLHGGIEKALTIQNLACPGSARFTNAYGCATHFGCLETRHVGTRKFHTIGDPTHNGETESERRWSEYLSETTIVLNTSSEAVLNSGVTFIPQTKYLIEVDNAKNDCWTQSDEHLIHAVADLLERENGTFPTMQAVMHTLCKIGYGPKLEWLKNMMDDNDIPIVVFCAYKATLEVTAGFFDHEGISYVKVDGSITGKERTSRVAQFQGAFGQEESEEEKDSEDADGGDGKAPRVFLAQIDAACTSISLTRAYISVCLDHTWKAANYDQALARTCRRGQTRRCHHYDLVANQFQKRVVERLRMQANFDSKVAAYQESKRILDDHKVRHV